MERAVLRVGTGAHGDFRSFLLRAFKASDLISCREALRVPGPSSHVTVDMPTCLAPPQPVAPRDAPCWGWGWVEPARLQA